MMVVVGYTDTVDRVSKNFKTINWQTASCAILEKLNFRSQKSFMKSVFLNSLWNVFSTCIVLSSWISRILTTEKGLLLSPTFFSSSNARNIAQELCSLTKTWGVTSLWGISSSFFVSNFFLNTCCAASLVSLFYSQSFESKKSQKKNTDAKQDEFLYFEAVFGSKLKKHSFSCRFSFPAKHVLTLLLFHTLVRVLSMLHNFERKVWKFEGLHMIFCTWKLGSSRLQFMIRLQFSYFEGIRPLTVLIWYTDLIISLAFCSKFYNNKMCKEIHWSY